MMLNFYFLGLSAGEPGSGVFAPLDGVPLFIVSVIFASCSFKDSFNLVSCFSRTIERVLVSSFLSSISSMRSFFVDFIKQIRLRIIYYFDWFWICVYLFPWLW